MKYYFEGCHVGDDTEHIPSNPYDVVEFGIWPFKKKKGKQSWTSRALGSAGKVVTTPVRLVTHPVKTTKKIAKSIKKVPVVGESIGTLYEHTSEPIKFAQDIVHKKGRIDKAAYASLKRHVKRGQALAPAAQVALQAVPGTGNIISGAIGAGHALSKGKRIDKVFVEGVKGAIPGAPIVRAGYSLIKDVRAKKKPSKIQIETFRKTGVDGLKLAANVSAAMDGDVEAGIEATKEISRATNPAVKKEIQTAVSLAAGSVIQEEHVRGAGSSGSIEMLYKKGKVLVKNDPVLLEIFRHPDTQSSVIGLVGEVRFGFVIGIASVSFKQNGAAITSIKNRLKNTKGDEAVVGFYMAIAYHIGKTSVEPLEPATALQEFGYFVAEGISGTDLSDSYKQKILALIGSSPESLGTAIAVAEESWWERFIEWLGF